MQNPVSFYSGEWGWGVGHGLELDAPFFAPYPATMTKLGLCPWTTLGAPPSDPRYRLALHMLAMCVHPTFFDLATALPQNYAYGYIRMHPSVM